MNGQLPTGPAPAGPATTGPATTGQPPIEQALREKTERLRRNVDAVRAEIAAACRRAGRSPEDVRLLAVVKSVGAETARLLGTLGIADVGEGTLQGASAKREAVGGSGGLRWHLIGHLQTNKVRRAVEMFDGLHSLDSLRLARKIDEELGRLEERPDALREVYLEVNIARQSTKGGVDPADAEALLSEIRGLPRLARRLAGLMAMAPDVEDPAETRPAFRALRELRDRLAAGGRLPAGAGLSMGMSGDFPVAIEEGATVVRIGTRLFEGLGT